MCRLLAYAGAPVFLDRLLVEPEASLIAQSLAAREAKTVVNGDGCGIGWYGERRSDVRTGETPDRADIAPSRRASVASPLGSGSERATFVEPGTYRGVLPAWSDGNLASLCRQIRSGMFVAHIRSATAGDVSPSNCHPFAHGPHLFLHNGQVGDYERIRRRVDALIPDDLYAHRRGNGDSEVIFLAALARGLDADPVAAVAATLGEILAVMRAAGVAKPLRFAAVHADGKRLRCFRWSSDGRAPTLYWRAEPGGWVVASEPFDAGRDWRAVPPGRVLTLSAAGVEGWDALTVPGGGGQEPAARGGAPC